MTPTLTQALAWAADGAAHLRGMLTRMGDDAFAKPSSLPDWTRAHVLTHVARNADAMVNLVTWARTGVPTPAYPSPDERARGHRGGRRALARGDPRRPRSRRRTGSPPPCGRCRRRPGRRASRTRGAAGSWPRTCCGCAPARCGSTRSTSTPARRSPTCPGRCCASCSPTPPRRWARGRTSRGCCWCPPTSRGPGRWGRCPQDRTGGRWRSGGPPRSSPRGCSAGRRAVSCARPRGSAPDATAMALTSTNGAHPGSAASPDFAALRAEFGLPDGFPPAVLAEAAAAAAVRPAPGPHRVDATDVELVTIDPPGSKDLDQAVGVVRRGQGDAVSACTTPSPTSEPSWCRARRWTPRCAGAGRRCTCPTARCRCTRPCSPRTRRACCPDGPRAAVLWRIDLDGAGEPVSVDVRRAVVRSRARLDYAGVQATVDAGSDPSGDRGAPRGRPAAPRPGRAPRGDRAGAARAGGRARGVEPAGGWTVQVRQRPPVEDWNAEISLLTGTTAARIMLDAGIGVLRTLPAAEPDGRRRPAGGGPGARASTGPRARPRPSCCPGCRATHPPRWLCAGPRRRCCAAPATPRSTPPAGRRRPPTPDTPGSARRTRT